MKAQQQQEVTTRQHLLDRIAATRRFMVKIGSNRIVCTEKNLVHMDWLQGFIGTLPSLGREFAVTTSGAIAIERVLGNRPAPKTIAEKQAYAAMGQPKLYRLYEEAFQQLHGTETSQILVTKNNLVSNDGRREIVDTLRVLRQLGSTPIINENDTVATEEIKFGDNDTLSAHAACADGADTLILITDVDGLYSDNPNINPNAVHYEVIDKVEPHHIEAAGGPIGDHSRGGMETKLEAAFIAAKCGVDTFMIKGDKPDCLTSFFNGSTKCTLVRGSAFQHYFGHEGTLRQIAQRVHGSVLDMGYIACP